MKVGQTRPAAMSKTGNIHIGKDFLLMDRNYMIALGATPYSSAAA
jgi:hypothetical protein